MALDERNFRSAYYEKVGCRSVEERKSLEILFNEKPISEGKLKQFCSRFTVPTSHRNLLWNLLLEVLPYYTESKDYVMEQRRAVYDDLLRALIVMRIIDEKITPKSRIFYAMWLLETKQLSLGFNINSESNFVEIVECLLQIFENDVETYWMAKKFLQLTEEIERETPLLLDSTYTLLKKEDTMLYKHLFSKNILHSLPVDKWYGCCFAGVIEERALVRIWDKICGGYIMILKFVMVAIFTTMRQSLLKCSDRNAVVKCIENIKNEDELSDTIVFRATNHWQQNKGPAEFQYQIKPKTF